jgi:type II secretory pathway pseudopilin PulG
MKVNQKGFGVVEILIILVIVGLLGAVGWLVYDRQKIKTDNMTRANQTSQQALNQQTPQQAAKTADPYMGWKEFENASLALTFKYPAEWKIVDDSSNLGTLIRVQSSDYLRDENIGFSGTEISISPNASQNSYSADKQRAATSTYGYHNDVKDLTVGGKPAFSYSKSLNETGYTAFYVEVDLGTKGARAFLYGSETKNTPQKYDTTNLAVFNKLLESVTFQ